MIDSQLSNVQQQILCTRYIQEHLQFARVVKFIPILIAASEWRDGDYRFKWPSYKVCCTAYFAISQLIELDWRVADRRSQKEFIHYIVLDTPYLHPVSMTNFFLISSVYRHNKYCSWRCLQRNYIREGSTAIGRILYRILLLLGMAFLRYLQVPLNSLHL